MSMQLYKRLRSERGATFSFALLLFIVCTVVSAIVLAAATASAGQFAKLGKIDQHYYAVTSAAQMFQKAVDESGPLILKQERKGTQEVTRTTTTNADRTTESADESVITPASAVVTLSSARAAGKQTLNSFLPSLTHLAYVGSLPGTPSTDETNIVLYSSEDGDASSQGLKVLANSLGAKAWDKDGSSVALKPFDSDKGWTDKKEVVYTITPSLDGYTGEDEETVAVQVTARLKSDWTMELEFVNAGAEDDTSYYLYMALAADVDDDISIDKKLGEVTGVSTTEDAGTTTTTVTNSQAVTWTDETSVTWHVRQVVPGRRLA